jgi:hypothetical protein
MAYRYDMDMESLSDQNWHYLESLLPAGWEAKARTSGAVQRCRGFENIGDLLRTLLLHVGLGCSLRETSVVSKAAGWAQMSDVALLNKLRNSQAWLHWMCVEMLANCDLAMPACDGLRMRLIDGTDVKEPGPSGSLWRMHYSIAVPQWTCDSFKITPCEGKGSGETLRQFDVVQGDCLIADRGYSHAAGIAHAHNKGGHVIVRLHPQILPMEDAQGKRFDVLEHVKTLEKSGQFSQWPVWIKTAEGQRIGVRLCAVRKAPETTLLAERKVRRKASKNSLAVGQKALEYAKWVMVVTTVPEQKLGTHEVLEWYRIRWQIELAFKRLKTLAQFGHLPKYDDNSSRAWLYGKLLMVLLTEQMQRNAKPFSPWGCAYANEQDDSNDEVEWSRERDETSNEQMA